MMKLVYQTTGAQRGTNGDCFQACLATMLNLSLRDVPNFLEGVGNGEPITSSALARMDYWMKSQGCGGYVEFGFQLPFRVLLENMKKQTPDGYYILTGCTSGFQTHAVVCRGGLVVHDPATSPGHTVLTRACKDGFFRVGFLLYPV